MNQPTKGGRWEADPKTGNLTHVQKPTARSKPAEETEEAPVKADEKKEK
ncbi:MULTISPECIES: hypothetical protein [unclassified Ensifer]|nr:MULTISPECIES: hypothetical protein [unclassified Ensifer]